MRFNYEAYDKLYPRSKDEEIMSDENAVNNLDEEQQNANDNSDEGGDADGD